MKNHAVALACTIAATALVITACDKDVSGQPIPPAGTATGSSSRAFSKAPAVTEPLDATKYIAAPCSSLTAAQYQAFAAAPGAPDDIVKSPNCSWSIDGGATRLSIIYSPEASQGLSGVYAQNDVGFWDKGYFEPTTVSGYPAVYASVADHRASGACQLNVGVNDYLYFASLVQSRVGDDSCTAAMNVAKAVIETVKKGA